MPTADELSNDEAEGLTAEEIHADESEELTAEESHTGEAEELTAEELLILFAFLFIFTPPSITGAARYIRHWLWRHPS